MALDTFAKRGSAINVTLPFRPWLSVPVGTITVSERLSLLKLVAGVAAEVVAGQLTWTITTDDDVPIPDVKVWLSSADPYTAATLIPGSIQRTDENGEVEYDLELDTVYYGFRWHPRYTWHDPHVFKWSTANDRWEQLVDGAFVEWTP